MKASRFLNSPFSSKKCVGSTFPGFSHWVGSECTEESTGITGVPCGTGMGQGCEEGHQCHAVGSAAVDCLGGGPGDMGEAGCAPQYPSSFPWGGSPDWWLCGTGTNDVGLWCPHGPAGLCATCGTQMPELLPWIPVQAPLSAPNPKQEMFPQGGVGTQCSWSNQEGRLSQICPGWGGLAWPHPGPGKRGRAVFQGCWGRERALGRTGRHSRASTPL